MVPREAEELAAVWPGPKQGGLVTCPFPLAGPGLWLVRSAEPSRAFTLAQLRL